MLTHQPAPDILGQILQVGGLDHFDPKLAGQNKGREGGSRSEALVLTHIERGFFTPRLESASEHLLHRGRVLLGGEDQLRQILGGGRRLLRVGFEMNVRCQRHRSRSGLR